MSRLFVVAAVALAGCGPGTNPNAKALHDLEAATRAFDRAVGLSTAFVTVGNIDTGATPALIASAILNRVQSETGGCVTATATDNTVHADLQAGCALATASVHAGGVVDVDVEPDMTTGGVAIGFTLTGVTVDNDAVAGAFVVSTANGNSFSWATDGLTVDGTIAVAPLITAGIAAGGATLDATHATANGAALVLAAVHERFTACYPDEGTATLGTLGVTFASDTPQTGAITLSTGGTSTLPVRAGCPK